MEIQDVVKIANKKVGYGQPTLIVAEIGINHNGDLDLALRMIRGAAMAGVDAVKFQSFRADSFVSKGTKKADHQKQTLEKSESTYAMWKRLEFSEEDIRSLQEEAIRHELLFFASVFDEESLEILVNINIPVFKIASGDLTYLSFIRKVASKQRPVILSVGMGTIQEIAEALEVIRSEGNQQVILLQCTAEYPAAVSKSNLLKIRKLREVFDVPVGLSDHTMSLNVPIAAASLGACLIERHFTLDKSLPGSDQAMSVNPAEMKMIVKGVREVEEALGSDQIVPAESEKNGRTLFRRGLIATRDIPRGTKLTEEMISIKRPATGIAPKYYEIILGRVTRHDIAADEPIVWEAV